MKRLFLCVTAVLISGCVSNQLDMVGTITSEETILVASKFEDSFNLQETGTTTFQNTKSEFDVQSWKVNDYIESAVISGLQPKYKPIANIEFRNQVSVPSENYLTGYPDAIQDQTTLKLAKDLGARYILILSPIEFQDAYFGTNQFVTGYTGEPILVVRRRFIMHS